ncbi:MAG: bifunctional indole-3-glycerol-phosphate synthase TrpC/phosphoribosylanthranilate isomerase TrpF [Kangiellaceae bacterium]|jgi:indole-3-glycerol phosphate synthase/phosphoribosylanthranilate isomerase|nr:bifunctional indole-3-glycerol-phosphate synthase TrpC/phosphoribosylanthranilate isomerase TrpF [Kangiellaceae bacterium]
MQSNNLQRKNKVVNNSSNVLNEIVEYKRGEVNRLKQQAPLEAFIDTLTESKISLEAALSQPGNRYILEYKKASPSRGDIRPDFTVEQCFSAYEPCADAYSVLTESKYFNGSHRFIEQLRKLTDKPILCKDFIVDEYQIYQARHVGADAILLMLSVLSDSEYCYLVSVANKLGLDVLTEVHTEQECLRAIKYHAKIIGINNRNLIDLTTDLAVTEQISQLIPDDRLVISESGVNSRQDVTRLAAHCDGFLIGTSLMSQRDVGLAAKALVYGRVKVCGVRSVATAQQSLALGASYLGLMFYPKSKRYIGLDLAKQIRQQVDGLLVGVFVDQPIEYILEVQEQCQLDIIQLHGGEAVSYIESLRQQLSAHCLIWKAIPISRFDDLSSIPELQSLVDCVVLDYKANGNFGGQGESFDWQLLKQMPQQVETERLVIAGGIDASNVNQLSNYSDAIIDLSSALETSPEQQPEYNSASYYLDKDVKRIELFFSHCRNNGKHNQG